MATEEFQKIMADLREREKRLHENLATLEEDSRAFARDQRELLIRIENDQGPTRPPQHPVADTLNTFHSTQSVVPPTAAPGTEVQPAEDEDSLFVPEDACIDEPTAVPRPRPKRRVTFADTPAIINSSMSPSGNLEAGIVRNTDESLPLQPTSNDANVGIDQPIYTGEPRLAKHARHFFGTLALMPCSGFTPVNPGDGQVDAAHAPPAFPTASDDPNMDIDNPSYTGNRRPSRRARHFPRTSALVLNTGFTPIMPDNKPAFDPQEFFGSHNYENFVGTQHPENFVGSHDPFMPAGDLVEPSQNGDYSQIEAEANEIDSHFICPYPDCWKLYVNSKDVEAHLIHDHPDWALVKDTIVDTNSM